LGLFMEQSVNVNARDSSGAPVFADADIDAALASFGSLNIEGPRGDAGFAELDCGGQEVEPDGWSDGLRYCTRGGTGSAGLSGSGPPFPGPPGGQFDLDQDGFGSLDPTIWPGGATILHHGATSAEIKTGDELAHRFMSGGVERESRALLQYVFATVPALVSYSDTAGNSANVVYCSPRSPPGCTRGPGTQSNPITVPPGDPVVLTLTFWRPQRRPIGTETGDWIDIGHLTYGATVGSGDCPPDAFLPASPPDPNLTLTPTTPRPLGSGWGFSDTRDDQPANPQNTLTYRLNLSRCLEANGLSFNPGEERQLVFKAAPGRPDFAQQTVFFRRQ
jgi:hypothetical protein